MRTQILDAAALMRALDMLTQRFKGPGGGAGVVKDGKVLVRRAWGHADIQARLPMAAGTRLPVCSISKQVTCAILLGMVPDLASLDAGVQDHLPNVQSPWPVVRQLAHNKSGLRDY